MSWYFKSDIKSIDNFIVNLTQVRVTWGEGTSVEEMPQSDWLVGVSMRHCLDWFGGQAQHIVDGIITRQGGLSWIKKLANYESEQVSKKWSSTISASVPAFIPALASLNNGLWLEGLSQINSFFLILLWVRVVYHSNRR